MEKQARLRANAKLEFGLENKKCGENVHVSKSLDALGTSPVTTPIKDWNFEPKPATAHRPTGFSKRITTCSREQRPMLRHISIAEESEDISYNLTPAYENKPEGDVDKLSPNGINQDFSNNRTRASKLWMRARAPTMFMRRFQIPSEDSDPLDPRARNPDINIQDLSTVPKWPKPQKVFSTFHSHSHNADTNGRTTCRRIHEPERGYLSIMGERGRPSMASITSEAVSDWYGSQASLIQEQMIRVNNEGDLKQIQQLQEALLNDTLVAELQDA